MNFAQKKINNSILEKLKNEKNKIVSLNHLNFILNVSYVTKKKSDI